jgi:CheY-like chemotaxis protein
MPMTQTILLVEDDENDILFMKMALEMNGIQNPLQVAVHGREALQYLNGNDSYANRQIYPLPCLVLLDLKLPYVTGLEVLKKIRQDSTLQEVIVIILTSSQEESDMDQAYRLGANAYVVKPPNIDQLRELTKAIKDFWLVFNMPPRIARSSR